jgi:RNA polymerase sigma factor (sigma-70 family)
MTLSIRLRFHAESAIFATSGRIMLMTTEASASLAVELEGNLQQATDDLLTLAAKSGNGAAFVELSQRHSKRVHLLVYRILGNWEDAEDVLQDSLLKAFKHLGQFRGTCSFSTWLTTIGINSALIVLRKRRVHLEISYDRTVDPTETLESWELPDLSLSPELLCAGRETTELLRGAILRLPSSYQTVVELYHAKECSTNEIAQALGISVAATKSRLSRARTRLRALLPRVVYRGV